MEFWGLNKMKNIVHTKLEMILFSSVGIQKVTESGVNTIFG